MQSSISSFFGASKRKLQGGAQPIKKQKSETGHQPSVETSQQAPISSPSETASTTAAPTAPNTIPPPRSPFKTVSSKKEISERPVAGSIEGSDVEYLEIADTFHKIESTTKRLEITRYCADLFESVLKATNGSPLTLSMVVYLCINRLGPDYEGLELGLGESILVKALAESTGRSMGDVKKQYVKLGDLGQVAFASKKGQSMMFSKPRPLTVGHVFSKLKEIASQSGKESQQKKIGIIKSLLVNCRGYEVKYLVRSLEGKLRIGLAEKTVLIALSQAFLRWRGDGSSGLSPEEGSEVIKQVFSQCPNYEVIIAAALEHGLKELPENVRLQPGVPLKPMLAKPAKSVAEVFERFSNKKFTCEYKYDGERAQVHCANQQLRVYSRNMEDMSMRYPDVIEILPTLAKAAGDDFILDCEAVAWDSEQGRILPFQVLSTRKRKDVLSGDIKVKVCLFAFDVLYFNGESMLSKSLSERRQVLKDNFVQNEHKFQLATHMDTHDVGEIEKFLEQSVQSSCEGLMVKALEGSESWYEPSKRSMNWLKLKKDYLSGVGDSLDLVVVGGYFGRGKRTNVYGGFLLACYNPDSEEFETVCKIGTGFSEQQLQQLHDELEPLVVPTRRAYISHDTAANQQPDVWFEPQRVWEVLTADLSLSPVYHAGKDILDDGKGVSLRFPRFVREREDKQPRDSTSAQQIVEMYERQFLK